MTTLFMLMAQFNSTAVAVNQCAHLFGLSEREAMNRASANKLPIPTFRMRESQKAPLLVHLADLASYMDRQRLLASDAWQKGKEL